MPLDFSAFGTAVDDEGPLDFSKFGTPIPSTPAPAAFDTPPESAFGDPSGSSFMAEIMGSAEPTPATPRSGSVLDTAEQPLFAPGVDAMVRPEYIEKVRQEFGALPLEKRLTALQDAANTPGVRGRAAKVLLAQEQEKAARVTPLDRETTQFMRRTGEVPKTKAGTAPRPPERISFPDATPDFTTDETPRQAAERNDKALVASDAWGVARNTKVEQPKVEKSTAQRLLDKTVGQGDGIGGFVLETAGDAARGVLAGTESFAGAGWDALAAAARSVGGLGDFGRIAQESGDYARAKENNWQNPDDAKSLTYAAFQSMTQMAVSAGLTGGLGKAAIGVQSAISGANAIGEAYQAGKSSGEALERGVINFASEYLGEMVALKPLQNVIRTLGASSSTVKQFGAAVLHHAGADLAGEELTTAMEDFYDKFGSGGLKPNMTAADYLDDALHTAKVTVAQGLYMLGGGVGVKAARAPFDARSAEKQREAQIADAFARQALDPNAYDSTYVSPEQTARANQDVGPSAPIRDRAPAPDFTQPGKVEPRVSTSHVATAQAVADISQASSVDEAIQTAMAATGTTDVSTTDRVPGLGSLATASGSDLGVGGVASVRRGDVPPAGTIPGRPDAGGDLGTGVAREPGSTAALTDDILAAERNTPLMSSKATDVSPAGFYSALARGVDSVNAKAMPGPMWVDRINGLVKAGTVKATEIEATGLNDWLKAQEGKVTKDAVLGYLEQNGVQVGEVTKTSLDDKLRAVLNANDNLGYRSPERATHMLRIARGAIALGRSNPEDTLTAEGWNVPAEEHRRVLTAWLREGETDGPRYVKYKPKGGTNYTEKLLTLPHTEPLTEKEQDELAYLMGAARLPLNNRQTARLHELQDKRGATEYHSTHWDEPNVIAHHRAQDTTDNEGRKVRYLVELQSDFGQSIRTQRAAGKSVPAAPFVQNTEHWVGLALRHAIKTAVDDGMDRVVLPTGQENADYYNLSKHVEHIRYEDNSADGVGEAKLAGPPTPGTLLAFDVEGNRVIEKEISNPTAELPELIGKEAAARLLEQPAKSERTFTAGGNHARTRSLSGQDLDVGGAGMKSFYDKIVPSITKDVVRKLGGEGLKTITLANGEERLGFDLTPQMRLKVKDGVPLFSRKGGETTNPDIRYSNKPSFEQGGYGNTQYANSIKTDGPPKAKLASTAPISEIKAAVAAFKHPDIGIDIAVDNSNLSDAQQAASSFARMLGRTMTFVKAEGGKVKTMPNGFVLELKARHIFADRNATDHPAGIVVHEAFHTLPDALRSRFANSVRQYWREDRTAAFRKEFNVAEDITDEEIPAYMAQAVAHKASFWEALRDSLGNRDFTAVATHILKTLKNFLYRAHQSNHGQAFLDKYVTDVEAVQKALVSVYTEALREQGAKPDTTLAPSVVWSSKKPAATKSELNPDIVKILGPNIRNLLPAERAKLRRDTAQRLVDIVRTLPSTDEMAAVAWAGRAKRGWYFHSTMAIEHIFGPDAPRFAGLLAALSPQTSVESNLDNALRTWKNWVAAGRPTDAAAINRVLDTSVQGSRSTDSVLPAWRDNSVRVLSAENPEHILISGPKVNSFMQNLRGNVNEVTNDAWMATFAFVDKTLFAGSGLSERNNDPGKGSGYLAMTSRTRAAARRLTELTGDEWTPAEVQETVWSWAKTLYEAQEKAGLGAREILDLLQGDDNTMHELIVATPDFKTLFHEGEYERTLRAAGYGEQLDTLQARTDLSRASPEELAGQAAPFAEDAQDRHLRNAASRLEQVREDRAAKKESKPILSSKGLSASETARQIGEDLVGRPVTPREQAPEITPAQRALQRKIALAYEAMPLNELANPLVHRAYDRLAVETLRQYKALPVRVEVYTDKGEPYKNSAAMRADVADNGHLFIYKTDVGTFGPEGADYSGHPMLEQTGLKDVNGVPLVYNDLFRAIHDYFGHVLAPVQFGPLGEEAAWRNHMEVTSDPYAKWALTSETRGQNSWVNFHPGAEDRPLKERRFADQKVGLLPLEYALTGDKTVDADVIALRDSLKQERAKGETVTGAVHYGKAPNLSTLAASSNGTGIKGAERERLNAPGTDPRLKQRVYFYLPTGEGTIPQREDGLGSHVYRADLRGLYDPRASEPKLKGSGNAFESAVLDAGYKGYINPEQGTAVVFGDTPARYTGSANDQTVVPRQIERAAAKITTRTEGDETVRRLDATLTPAMRQAVEAAAPSFTLQYGEARVKTAEADAADYALMGAGSSFQFGGKRPLFSNKGGQPADVPTWDMPADTRLDKEIYEWQNGRVDLKRAQKAIEEFAGGTIKDNFNAQLAETLFPGRSAAREKAFLKTDYTDLLREMALQKVTTTELGDYLLARHAPERNAYIATINDQMPDGGAGKNSKGDLMTTKAARQYIAALDPVERKKLERVAALVDGITKGTRALLVSEGLEKQETIDKWETLYPNYAPLFKDEAEEGRPHPVGSGFSVRGDSSKRSTGSEGTVTNVLAHLVQQREAAIVRAEKNRVAQSLYGLVLTHPNHEFWTVIRPGMSAKKTAAELQAMGIDPLSFFDMDTAPTVRVVDPQLGVIDRPNPRYKELPGALTLRINGEDRVILFNADNPRALRLALNLKGQDGIRTAEEAQTMLRHLLEIAARGKNWIASVNTQYNPVFGLFNAARDILWSAPLNLTTTELRGRQLEVWSHVPAAVIGVARSLRGDNSRTAWSDLWDQYQLDGGGMGARDMFADAGARNKAIEKELIELQNEGKLTPKRAALATLQLLDDYNAAIENGTRLAAYKTGLDHGMSRPQAARLARELTVDFSRKGRMSGELSPYYAFLGAAIQGNMRTLVTLAGPAGKKIITGGLALGALQALMLAAAGFEDDDITEWEKARNLIIPTGWRSKEKRYIPIPLAQGYLVIPNIGRVATDLMLAEGKDAGKKVASAFGEIVGALNVFGGGSPLEDGSLYPSAHGVLSTILPTVLDPVVELGFNKNFAGNPIERQRLKEEADNRPGHALARESTQRQATGQVYLGLSKAINSVTGGSDYEAGKLSPTPERLRYIAQVVGGGALRELEKLINFGVNVANDTPTKARDMPLGGRFAGEVDEAAVTSKRYNADKNRVLKIESSLKLAEKAGDGEAWRRIYDKDPTAANVYKELGKLQKDVNELTKYGATVINDPKEMQHVDELRTRTMQAFSAQVKMLEQLLENRKPTLGDKLRGKTEDAP